MKQTTVRIPEDVHTRFKRITKEQKKDMNEVLKGLMKRWSDEQSAPGRASRAQMDQTVALLVNAVRDQLLQNQQWAIDALLRAGLGLPGSTVFDRRIDHFSQEKQEIGRRLAYWAVRRAARMIDDGRKVVLLCDSGTTLFWFLRALGEAIEEVFAKSRRDRIASLTVLTNNIPGAESFVAYASHREIATADGKSRISDLVDCRLLAGTFLPEYVAITGPDTDHDLETYAAAVRSSGKKGSAAGAVIMAITTGNWISLKKSKGPAAGDSPIFLARGRGHAAFKRKLLSIADEIFCIAPLGKLLVFTSVDELNELLGYQPDAKDPQRKAYEAVLTPPSKRQAVKIVSTTRESKSVLRDYSTYLHAALAEHSSLPEPQHIVDADIAMPIAKVKHLLFAFDAFANENSDTQLLMELPHDQTRNTDFTSKVFRIRS